ncbi:MAG: response regulator [Ferruginibacter sp.]
MVLIVDDNPGNLFTLKTLLELNHFTVDTAASGEEALKAILKKEYSLIILDVQMPGMDGFEVAETVSGYSKSKDIPIIFLSAVNTEKRFMFKGYASGAVDYMTKPFDPDILVMKVKTLYRLSKQTSALKTMQQELLTEIDTRKKAEALLSQSHELLELKVKERTAELATMNQALKTSNEELQQYAYLASHDLQEPLRKITTFSSMLLESKLLMETREMHLLDKIVQAANRMRDLIHDLLLYSQISQEQGCIITDLNDIIKGALVDLELPVKDKQAVVNYTNMPSLEGVAGQLQQVFMNIISNAIKYAKIGLPPVVNISAERVDSKTFNAAVTEQGNFYRIMISDNGIGIDEKYADKMFAIFQRLHGRTQYEGTGIGLAIVRKIIERHHGIVQATGKEGLGTTITIVLPVKQPVEKTP